MASGAKVRRRSVAARLLGITMSAAPEPTISTWLRAGLLGIARVIQRRATHRAVR